MRTSGILLPIASLPGEYGIGCFSKEAYAFVDFLVEAKQTYWQIVPIGPTGYGDSPYQSFSTFAGNPYFIDLETLILEGLLTEGECKAIDFGTDENYIDYAKIYDGRFYILKSAYRRSDHLDKQSYADFLQEHKAWLDTYATYMAIKDSLGGVSFTEWDEDIKNRQPEVLDRYACELKEEIDFYRFVQYKFFQQWTKLKNYANAKGVKIIGDIPVYVSPDSADVWANPELFQMINGAYTGVAGCPPDGFSATGQLWGNPLYDWEYHKKTGFSWWISRIGHCAKLYDVIRIDHFRGFDQYYAIPAGEKTAQNGRWEDGPGFSLFAAIKEALGEISIIAEDLGYITDGVRELVEATGFPNMKVLEFAFDSRDSSGANNYLPFNYRSNSVVYTGTHDNETLCGWLKSITPDERKCVARFVNVPVTDDIGICDGLIRTAHACVSDYCIIPIQDYLHLGNEARINFPSTLGGNWKWRVDKKVLITELAKEMAVLTATYGRLPAKDRGK